MLKKSNLSVSYIIAGYNEEEYIIDAVEYCIQCLDMDFRDYEIILVDDASTDSTGAKMDKLAAKYPQVKVMHNLINLNFGASVQRGMVSAKYDFIIYNAVDLPLNPKYTKKLLGMMKNTDVLVLQRIEYLDTSTWRRIASLLNRAIVFALFPMVKAGLPDTNYVQIFRKEVVSDVLPMARGPVFTWPEMIFRAKYKGLRVQHMRFEYKPRIVRKGAFGKPHDIIWSLYEMLRFRIHRWTGKI